jgi:alkanesulfonate monooxygenase SsuD/methylene tetrahydromethanopterin reductase-like flavin-dependent oxidoreductase (luciferase family)
MNATAAVATPREIHPWVAEGQRRIRFGIVNGPLADWADLSAWVLRVEQLGFDSFWIADHTMLLPADPWTTLAAVAVSAPRLRLGTLVSCVYYRPPALLARVAADVDRLSGGRLVLGLGAGDYPKEFGQLGLTVPPFRTRAAALAETVQLVRGLWSEARVTTRGCYVRAEDARLASRPVQQPRVPLLIGGGGERVTLRQVAQYADACNFGPTAGSGSACGVAEVRRKLAALARHCADLGRPAEAVLRSHVSSPVIAATEAAVEARLATRADWATMVEDEREPGRPRQFTTHYLEPSVAHHTYKVTAGTPAQLVAYYRDLIDAGMQYFIVACGRDPEALRVLAEEVIPHVG